MLPLPDRRMIQVPEPEEQERRAEAGESASPTTAFPAAPSP